MRCDTKAEIFFTPAVSAGRKRLPAVDPLPIRYPAPGIKSLLVIHRPREEVWMQLRGDLNLHGEMAAMLAAAM